MSRSLPDIDVWMIHRDLAQAPLYSFPAGYEMRFYREGDVAKWVEIQQAADPFYTATAKTFARSMPGDKDFLSQRVMFLVEPSGQDIGSITAWAKQDVAESKAVQKNIGQVHWVAIIANYQGLGLAQPMFSACIQQMITLGHTQACLSTNTKRIPAINLYRKFGFEPVLKRDDQKEAWNEILPNLKYEENS